jgi:hypothetical protein
MTIDGDQPQDLPLFGLCAFLAAYVFLVVVLLLIWWLT